MEPTTTRYLLTAQRNRGFVESALADTDLLPALRERGAVAAFYSAVHYINAYLYERQRFEPENHRQRYAAIPRIRELREFRRDYQQLNDAGYRARYVPMHRVSDDQLRRLVEVHLRRIGDNVTDLLASDE